MNGGNKILWAFIGFETLYLGCAILHLVIPLTTHASLGRAPNRDNVAGDLLLDHCPLTASLVNSILMFVVFLMSLPAMFIKTNRKWLIVHAWGIVITAFVSLGIGLRIWFDTLETHKNLEPIWNSQEEFVQSLLQSRFECCGYNNPSLFIRDQTCPTAAVAAQLGSCTVPFGSFANQFLDVVFTGFFGFCAVDMLLLLATMCLIKDRKERERFRKIDMKLGGMQVL
ncbi:uncharacterized protein HMPREF1541_05032 [Cyphellophora europaea CBS 101466]|uniref:Tetraspanin n=1 Tax=Cyphellophora europaea (strain CBS 101466) TaxID=1220924 RepID=W2RWD0_CYPE1|nr:uncharacterized protein HMPREF1541_05032 [Cyphellophora europaea CBS 101466]ETN40752.1 hypothetical protein HMPREF1541_05032 [Cyphellophora europaea CBS 101466]